MRPSTFFLRIFALLLPIAVISTTYLYLYPLFWRCAFPSPRTSTHPGDNDNDNDNIERAATHVLPEFAPFRLLALGDPQLEGDSSFPDPVPWRVQNWQGLRDILLEARWHDLQSEIKIGYEDVREHIISRIKSLRKSVDLLGNDLYLAHIYRTIHWWSQPTHVTVLGDLLGSQWIDNAEFERRSSRFWHRVFRNAQKASHDLLGYVDGVFGAGIVQEMGSDPEWSHRLISLVGNHDIGYAGDLDQQRIDRFERAFGPVNGEIRFKLPVANASEGEEAPELRLVVLNSMNIDSPAFYKDLQSQTHDFINKIIDISLPVESRHHATILLTHIPLHKEAGICVDDPFFSYFPASNGDGVKEQNMLSEDMSRQAILQGIFGKTPNEEAAARGMGRNGLILTGHDHEGCDVLHYADRENQTWHASGWNTPETTAILQAPDTPRIREVTVRSMMGDFGGNAALVSAWWDARDFQWRFGVANCAVGVQHIWWAIHVVDLITALVSVAALLAFALEEAFGVGKEAHSQVKHMNGAAKRSHRPKPANRAPVKPKRKPRKAGKA